LTFQLIPELVHSTNIEGESEFLFVPYSVFTVISVDWKPNPVWSDPHLKASLDNLNESEDLLRKKFRMKKERRALKKSDVWNMDKSG